MGDSELRKWCVEMAVKMGATDYALALRIAGEIESYVLSVVPSRFTKATDRRTYGEFRDAYTWPPVMNSRNPDTATAEMAKLRAARQGASRE